jgi:Spy/CpxP family protein refolding chaperone
LLGIWLIMAHPLAFKRILSLWVLSVLLAGCVQDSETGSSPYVDLRDTEIRGLSEQEIHDLRIGAGMGLALPAELNGWPGPLHVIEHEDELGLSAEQRQDIRRLRGEMLQQAVPLGEEILQAHAALEEAFRTKEIDESSLKGLLEHLESLQTQLRYVHLETHLKTYPVLTEHQRIMYDELRGYSDGDGHVHDPSHGHGH